MVNSGSTRATIISITVAGANASEFSVTSDCGGPIYIDCFVNATFAPSAVGIRTASAVFTVSGGATQSALLVGQGVPPAKVITFSIPDAVFPSLPVGLPAQNAAYGGTALKNTGTVPVNIQSISITGADAQDFQLASPPCGQISPLGICSVTVTFLPQAIGNRYATLTVTDDAVGGTQSIPLFGVGLPPQNSIQVFPAGVAFGNVGISNSAPSQITVQNTGSEPITINSASVTGLNASDFSLASNTCQPTPYMLAAQSQCYLNLLFTPAAVGSRLANLEVVDSAPSGRQVVPLEGMGTPDTTNFTVSPLTLSYGDLTVGSLAVIVVSIQNEGTQPIDISAQVEGAGADDFSIVGLCGTMAWLPPRRAVQKLYSRRRLRGCVRLQCSSPIPFPERASRSRQRGQEFPPMRRYHPNS